jgi:hypothetical protein
MTWLVHAEDLSASLSRQPEVLWELSDHWRTREGFHTVQANQRPRNTASEKL